MTADPGPVPQPLKALPFLISFPSRHMIGEAKTAELLVDSLSEKTGHFFRVLEFSLLSRGWTHCALGHEVFFFFMAAAGVYSVNVTIASEG